MAEGEGNEGSGGTQAGEGSEPVADLGDAGKKALDAERARARNEEKARKASEKRASDLEAELAKFREQNQSEQEKAIEAARKEAADAARSEVQSELHKERIESALIRAASNKLTDPRDAVVYLAGELEVGADGRPDEKAVASAIEQLLKDKPYLASGANKVNGSADQGARDRTKAKPGDLTSAIAAHYSG